MSFNLYTSNKIISCKKKQQNNNNKKPELLVYNPAEKHWKHVTVDYKVM